MSVRKTDDPEVIGKTLAGSVLDGLYSVTPVQPFSEGDGIRVQPTVNGAEGYRDIISLSEGFQLVLGDLHYSHDVDMTYTTDALLKFHYRLMGNGSIGIVGDEYQIKQHTGGVLLTPEGIKKSEHYLSGEHEKSVTLVCSSEFLSMRLGGIQGKLPHALMHYLEGKPADAYHLSMPLRADMATAAAALLTNEFTGSLRKVHAESKALELLILSVQAIIDAEEGVDRPEYGVTQRDVARIEQARDLLDENYIEPPTIGALARMVGVNESKLMHLFKHLFGQTIFDYTQALRMEKAKKLLETTELSITEVAFEVGYEYSSNFTTAFRRHFGITPSVAREACR